MVYESSAEITGDNIIELITDIDESPSPEDLDRNINNLVVYDDVMLVFKKIQLRYFPRRDTKALT
jgi:hypothetical protein